MKVYKKLYLFDIDGTLVVPTNSLVYPLNAIGLCVKPKPIAIKVLNILANCDLGIWCQQLKFIQMHKLKSAGIDRYFNSNQIWTFMPKVLLLPEIIQKNQDREIVIVDNTNYSYSINKFKNITLTTIEKLYFDLCSSKLIK